MWPWHAAGGKPGLSNYASCVDCMMLPLGVCMLMGVLVGCWLMTGVLTVKKYAMHPKSAMAKMGF